MPTDFATPAGAPLTDELLDAYVRGTLPAADRQALDARLLIDPAARAQLAEHQTFVAGVRHIGRTTLRTRLQRIEEELGPAAPASAPRQPSAAPALTVAWRRRRWVATLTAAAVLVLAAGIGALWQLHPEHFLDRGALALRYGVADPGLPVLMSDEGADPDGVASRPQLNQAMNAYRRGRYADALAAWDRLPARAVGPDTVSYYRGIFLLRLRRAREAAQALAAVRQQPASALRARADYYAALAQWADNQPEAARQAFARLAAQPHHPYAQAARDVLPLVH